jgi:ATP-dependent exoDNAse (exonuclease V) alpha subunit
MENQLKRHSEQLKETCIKRIADPQGMLETAQKQYDERKALLQNQIREIREIITKIDKETASP